MEFNFSIGGYPGPFFTLVLEGERLVLMENSSAQPDPIREASIEVADNDIWQSLVGLLMEVNWKNLYENDEVVDGTQWEITFLNSGKEIRSAGTNSYPRQFKKLLFYLNALFKEKGITIY
jgi:hypothetical protein